MELKENGEFIGWAGLSRSSFEAHFTPAVKIGWRLASQHSGKGYVMEKIGLHHKPQDDFDHPRLAIDSPLRRHVLYRLSKLEYLK